MLSKFGLTLAAAFGMLLLTAEVADAQIVTVRPNYTVAGPPPRSTPATTQPSGKFSTKAYPNGDGRAAALRTPDGIGF